MLNNNQVSWRTGGSGLFVGTAIIEHSCDFNCSYTTKNNKLYMTATKDIPAGAGSALTTAIFLLAHRGEAELLAKELRLPL